MLSIATIRQQEIAAVIESAGGDAARIISALRENGLAVVPRTPTAEMLKDAWAYIHDEDGLGAWSEMISSYEGSLEAESVGNSVIERG